MTHQGGLQPLTGQFGTQRVGRVLCIPGIRPGASWRNTGFTEGTWECPLGNPPPARIESGGRWNESPLTADGLQGWPQARSGMPLLAMRGAGTGMSRCYDGLVTENAPSAPAAPLGKSPGGPRRRVALDERAGTAGRPEIQQDRDQYARPPRGWVPMLSESCPRPADYTVRLGRFCLRIHHTARPSMAWRTIRACPGPVLWPGALSAAQKRAGGCWGAARISHLRTSATGLDDALVPV